MAIQPDFHMRQSRCCIRQYFIAKHHVTGIPCLRIKLVKGVVLIVHAQIDQAWVGLKKYPFIEIVWVHAVLRDQAQVIRQKREVKQIAGTHDDSVECFAAAVTEVADIATKVSKQWPLFHISWPFKADRLATIADGDGLSAVLITLRCDVFGGIASTHYQHVLALKF